MFRSIFAFFYPAVQCMAWIRHGLSQLLDSHQSVFSRPGRLSHLLLLVFFLEGDEKDFVLRRRKTRAIEIQGCVYLAKTEVIKKSNHDMGFNSYIYLHGEIFISQIIKYCEVTFPLDSVLALGSLSLAHSATSGTQLCKNGLFHLESCVESAFTVSS